MKKAILEVADTGPLESLAYMLQLIGYECYLPSESLKNHLRKIGCDSVLDIKQLVDSQGYDPPSPLPFADSFGGAVLFDIKAHRNAPKIWKHHPDAKICWYRINGGKPEHVVNDRGDMGDEVNIPCPIVTPNQWYGVKTFPNNPAPWEGKAYTCWPPFVRFQDYQAPRDISKPAPPIALIHNVAGWGYSQLIPHMDRLGVRCHGIRCPDGLVNHREIPCLLSRVLCMVHLKSSDAPGYAIYEAMSAACPIICPKRLITKNLMGTLLIPNETCLTFDTWEDGPLNVEQCAKEIGEALKQLHDKDTNRRIGNAAREQLKKVMWTDVAGFKAFMERHYP